MLKTDTSLDPMGMVIHGVDVCGLTWMAWKRREKHTSMCAD